MDRDDVKHVCPQCGGAVKAPGAADRTALGLIVPSQRCDVCFGAGVISDERCRQLQRELDGIPWG